MPQLESIYSNVLGLVYFVSVSIEMIEIIRFGGLKGQTLEFQVLFSWLSSLLPPVCLNSFLCRVFSIRKHSGRRAGSAGERYHEVHQHRPQDDRVPLGARRG